MSPPQSVDSKTSAQALDPAVSKHKVCKAQRQLSFDPGNIPVPGNNVITNLRI